MARRPATATEIGCAVFVALVIFFIGIPAAIVLAPVAIVGNAVVNSALDDDHDERVATARQRATEAPPPSMPSATVRDIAPEPNVSAGSATSPRPHHPTPRFDAKPPTYLLSIDVERYGHGASVTLGGPATSIIDRAVVGLVFRDREGRAHEATARFDHGATRTEVYPPSSYYFNAVEFSLRAAYASPVSRTNIADRIEVFTVEELAERMQRDLAAAQRALEEAAARARLTLIVEPYTATPSPDDLRVTLEDPGALIPAAVDAITLHLELRRSDNLSTLATRDVTLERAHAWRGFAIFIDTLADRPRYPITATATTPELDAIPILIDDRRR